MQSLDWRLFRLVNGLAGHHALLDSLVRACAERLEYVMLLLVASLWVTPGEDYGVSIRRQRLVVYAILAALLGLAINQFIGMLWFRPRPFAQHAVTLLVPRALDSAFPSDHATGGFALAAAVLLARDRWARLVGLILFPLAGVLAFSRVYVGAHYPFDVLAGALIGIAAAATIWLTRPLLDPVLRSFLGPLHRVTYIIIEQLGLREWQVPSGRHVSEGMR